jgi:carboxymethylenebutenolidase
MSIPASSLSRVSRTLSILACLAAALPFASAQQPAAPAAPAAAPGGPGGPGGGGPGGPGGGGGRGGAPAVPAIEVAWDDSIPAGTAEHATRQMAETKRKGEWVDIAMKDGTKLHSWVTYPDGTARAGVVLVIHDIFGLADVTRAVGDQLAQDGFIAIVPDFLSGKGPNGGGVDSLRAAPAAAPAAGAGGRGGGMGGAVGTAIQGLTDLNDRLDAAMAYGTTLARSNGKTGVVGFCWGGTGSFNYAAYQQGLNAAVVYYGNPTLTGDMTYETKLASLKAPVLGLYAGNDMRINATIPDTEAAMKKLGKSYETHIYDGAGHGFMSAQAGAGGANLKAAQQSWPLVVAFYKKHLN